MTTTPDGAIYNLTAAGVEVLNRWRAAGYFDAKERAAADQVSEKKSND